MTNHFSDSCFYGDKSVAAEYIKEFKYPWEALRDLRSYIFELISRYENDNGFTSVTSGVLIAKSASIASDALLSPPCFVDCEAEIRKGAFIRGGAIIGKECVVGNSCEIKNSILFDKAKAPHFNYVGDSILGYSAHLGAGVITSNLKCDKSEIVIKLGSLSLPTGLKKLGAIIGDFCEIGCGAVLNPGAVIGSGTVVYPLSSVRGYIPSGMIYKGKDTISEGTLPFPSSDKEEHDE